MIGFAPQTKQTTFGATIVEFGDDSDLLTAAAARPVSPCFCVGLLLPSGQPPVLPWAIRSATGAASSSEESARRAHSAPSSPAGM